MPPLSQQYRVGQRVTAFVPHTLGVIKQGTIVKVGTRYLHIDYGLLGVRKTHPRDLTTF